MTSGYSGTPLARKLGIKDNSLVGIINGPDGFETTLGEIPIGATVHDQLEVGSDIFLIFSRWKQDMNASFRKVIGAIPADGAIWVAWPKKSSGVDTDLTEDVIRDLFLPTGMVDNKVCAIDQTWSGLRFVVRKENRPDWDKPS